MPVDYGTGNLLLQPIPASPKGEVPMAIDTGASTSHLEYFNIGKLSGRYAYVGAYYVYPQAKTTMIVVDGESGLVSASRSVESAYVNNYRIQKDVLYVRDWDYDIAYAWTAADPGNIAELDVFYSQRNYAVYKTQLAGCQAPDSMVLFNPPYYSGPSWRVLKSTVAPNESPDNPLPYGNDNWDWDSSHRWFAYVWFDDIETGNTYVTVRDFDNNEVASYVSEIPGIGWFNFFVSSNRVFLALVDRVGDGFVDFVLLDPVNHKNVTAKLIPYNGYYALPNEYNY